MASNLKVYRHILNKKNSILVNSSVNLWKNKIKDYFNKPAKYNYLSYNANKDVKKFTWNKKSCQSFKIYK